MLNYSSHTTVHSLSLIGIGIKSREECGQSELQGTHKRINYQKLSFKMGLSFSVLQSHRQESAYIDLTVVKRALILHMKCIAVPQISPSPTQEVMQLRATCLCCMCNNISGAVFIMISMLLAHSWQTLLSPGRLSYDVTFPTRKGLNTKVSLNTLFGISLFFRYYK